MPHKRMNTWNLVLSAMDVMVLACCELIALFQIILNLTLPIRPSSSYRAGGKKLCWFSKPHGYRER